MFHTSMKTLLALSFSLIFFYCTGQSETKQYFDAYWKPLKNVDGAAYYRIATKTENNTYLVNDYYISGKIQMNAICNTIEPKLTTVGNATLYYDTGTKQEEGAFVNEEPAGLHKYYSIFGELTHEIIHRKEEKKYVSYYGKDGSNQLHNGNATINDTYPDMTIHREISDSVLVAWYTIYPGSSDTIYGLVDRPALYPGGNNKMYKDLNENLEYPRSARKKGTEGRVYIQFSVSKTGSVRNMKILKSLTTDCDNAASFAINHLNKWVPAQFKGKPVATLFVLPVTFKLR